MANGWFFKWHNINIPNRVVEVEDFYGGQFAVGGIVFQGQIRDLYWRSVGKHLIDRVHKGFKQWEAASAAYPLNLKSCSLDALEHILNGYIARIVQKAVETDRALRGRGDQSRRTKIPVFTHLRMPRLSDSSRHTRLCFLERK